MDPKISAPGNDAVPPTSGREMPHANRQLIFEVTFPTTPTLLALLVAVVCGWVIGMTPIRTTLTAFIVGSTNPAAVQAGSVRVVVDDQGGPAYTVPALLPGEAIERIVQVGNTGSLDARLDLAVLPDSPQSFVADPKSGLSLAVDRCVGGVWATTTPVPTTPTPPPAGARYACAGTPGAFPQSEAMYRGPIVPRGLAPLGASTATPQAIPLRSRLSAGEREAYRLRVALPEDPAGQGVPADRQGSVSFEWRAVGVIANTAGTVLATVASAPVTATSTVGGATATASATATPTATVTRTATATATASATTTPPYPAYAGYAVALDGIVDAIGVGWTAGVGPLANRSAWTFEAWVNPDSVTGPRTLYAEQASGSATDLLAIRLNGAASGSFRLEVGQRTGSTMTWSGAELPASVVAGRWTHLAVAFSAGTRLDLAADGLTVASLTTSAATTRPDGTPTTALIGRAGDGATAYAGVIDEVRVWSVARVYTTADTTYLQRLAGREPGLLAHFPMSAYGASTAGGLTLRDQSGNGLTATLSGGVRWVPSRAPVDRPATPHSVRLTMSDGITPPDAITRQTTLRVAGYATAGTTVSIRNGSVPVSGASAVAEENGSFTVTMNNLPSNAYAFVAVATDASGATSMASVPMTVIVDLVAPVAQIAYSIGATNPTYTTTLPRPVKANEVVAIRLTIVDLSPLLATPTFTLSGTGALGTVVLTETALGSKVFTGQVTVPAGDGQVFASVEATDVAQNPLATGPQGAFTVDNTRPVVTAVVANPYVTGTTRAFTVTFSEPVRPTLATSSFALLTTGMTGDQPVITGVTCLAYCFATAGQVWSVEFGTGGVTAGSGSGSIAVEAVAAVEDLATNPVAEGSGSLTNPFSTFSVISSVTLAASDIAPLTKIEYAIGTDNLQYGEQVARSVKVGERIAIRLTVKEVGTLGTQPAITLTGTGSLGGVSLTRTEAGPGTWFYTGSVTVPSGDGQVLITTGLLDASGQRVTANPLPAFTVDNSPPTFFVAYVVDGVYVTSPPVVREGQQITVYLSVSDAHPFRSTPTLLVTGTGGVASETTITPGSPYSVTVPSGNGAVNGTITAVDEAGNTLSQAVTPIFTVDNTAPVPGMITRQIATETETSWAKPHYVVSPTDANGVASVQLQLGSSATGTFTDSGAPVTAVTGDAYTLVGPTVAGTQYVRVRVVDRAGLEAFTSPLMVTTWNAATATSTWTIGGSAYFNANWLVLTPNQGSAKGGTYFESLVPTTGPVSISFDFASVGSADGICIPFFSSASAFLTGGAGGDLGCVGMTGSFWVGVSKYHNQIEVGKLPRNLVYTTPMSGIANNGTNRVTVVLTRFGSGTQMQVWAQIGATTPILKASTTISDTTLPSGGIYMGITAGTGGESAEHKVRNIVISGS